MFIERLHTRIDELSSTASKAKTGTTDARDRISELERKVAEQAKQLEERAQPTLSGLGTRVEQLLRLAEEQAKEHRGESKREAGSSSPRPTSSRRRWSRRPVLSPPP